MALEKNAGIKIQRKARENQRKRQWGRCSYIFVVHEYIFIYLVAARKAGPKARNSSII